MNLELQNKIRAHSLENLNEESCGLIMGNDIVKCKNIAEDKNSFYKINPADYLRISLKSNITGTYHSHVKERARLSLLDILNAENHKLKMIVYSIKRDDFLEYEPKGLSCDYIGRSFQMNKNDCFSVIRDYYQKELKININNYLRDDNWREKQPNAYEKNFEKEGFVKVEDLKINDVLLFKFKKNEPSNHAAIYLGNDLILHHAPMTFSSIENYSKTFKIKTAFILRHKSQCSLN